MRSQAKKISIEITDREAIEIRNTLNEKCKELLFAKESERQQYSAGIKLFRLLERDFSPVVDRD